MATKKEEVQSARAQELELIINELEELNVEARDKNVWIRTKWNLPNQKSWHLGTSDKPDPGPYTLGVEHPAPVPHVWKWADIEHYLLKLIDLCPLELTERQSVLLTNPAFGAKGVKVANTMRMAISLYKKGDDAETHMHSPNASRTIISDSGGFTMVEGEKIEPKRGDLVFTPNGTWHAHGNDDENPVIWADTHLITATQRMDFPKSFTAAAASGRASNPTPAASASDRPTNSSIAPPTPAPR